MSVADQSGETVSFSCIFTVTFVYNSDQEWHNKCTRWHVTGPSNKSTQCLYVVSPSTISTASDWSSYYMRLYLRRVLMTYCWCFYDRDGYLQGICTFCSRDSFCITFNMISMIFWGGFIFGLSCSCTISSTRRQVGSMWTAARGWWTCKSLGKKSVFWILLVYGELEKCAFVSFFVVGLFLRVTLLHLHTGGTHTAADWTARIPCSNWRLYGGFRRPRLNNVFIFFFIFLLNIALSFT